MVLTYKTSNSGAKNLFKGKWNEFHKEDFIKHGLEDFYWKPEESIDFDALYSKLAQIMQKQDFVFFEEVEVRPKFKFGKLSEVWVNFHHIK